MVSQLTHNTTQFNATIPTVVLICDGIESPANMGGIFRICDALGVKHLYFCHTYPALTSARLKRTSRSTHKTQPYTNVENPLALIKQLKANGFVINALELTNKSISIETYIKKPNANIALIIGNEKHGVSQELLAFCENHLHIEMLGNNSSMSVVQATAIALYALTKL